MNIYSKQEQWHSKLFRVLNSAACSILAYLTVLFVSGLAKALFTAAYGIKFNLQFFDSYPIVSTSGVFYLENTASIYSSGIVAVFFTGLLSFLLFNLLKKFDATFVIYFMWLATWSVIIFCSQALLVLLGMYDLNSVYYNNLVVVFTQINLPQSLAYILFPLSVILLTIVSIYSSKCFLRLAYSFRKVNKLKRRRKFFSEIVILPFLISSLFVTTMIFPEKFVYINLVYIGYGAWGILSSWILLFYIYLDKEKLNRNTSLQKFNLFVVLMFILAMTIIYWKLDSGITIEI